MDISALERKRRLIYAAQQVENIQSLDAPVSHEDDSGGYDLCDNGSNDELDRYVRMVLLGARMLETNRVRTVLMVMKVYVGLPRKNVARIYKCSHETVRQALLRAHQMAKPVR